MTWGSLTYRETGKVLDGAIIERDAAQCAAVVDKAERHSPEKHIIRGTRTTRATAEKEKAKKKMLTRREFQTNGSGNKCTGLIVRRQDGAAGTWAAAIGAVDARAPVLDLASNSRHTEGKKS